MTTQMPPPEPLDAQERGLARVLRALPGGEPPAALDASILRAATNAAAASRRPGARFLASTGALWGIGSAAAAVLAVGIAIQMRMSPDHRTGAESAPRAQAVSEVAEDDAVEVDLGQVRPEAGFAAPPPPPAPLVQDRPAQPPRAPSPQRREQAQTAASAAAPPPAAAPEPFAADALDEHVGSAAHANAASAEAEGRAGEDKEQYAAKAAAAQSAAAAAEPTRSRDERADLDAASAVGGLAGPRAAAPMKPASWIAEIRRLRDAGQIEAARARLVEFRRAYPQWVIPTDLAPLQSE